MRRAALSLALALAACSPAGDDEAAVRRELRLPREAVLDSLEAEPKKSGTFGREGLRIAAQFSLPPEASARAAQEFRAAGRWRRSFDVGPVQHLQGFPAEGVGGVRPSLVYCWVAVYEAGSMRELPCDLSPDKVAYLRYAAFDPQAGKLAAVFKNYY